MANLIEREIRRQKETLDLIPSENFPSEDILKIVGSPLMNKYSEGYPGKRYYPGNEYYDEIERLAQERALKAFGLKSSEWAVNVQPYSGSPANLEIYFALLNLGDTLIGMKLASGGHLTHGHKVSISGRIYNSVQYGLDPKTNLLDYKEIEKLARKYKPKIIISGLTAYPRRIDFEKFGKIAKKVGAYHMADISHIAGLIAARVHPSPFLWSDVVMTTTHKTLRGPRGAVIFSRKAKIKKFTPFIPSPGLKKELPLISEVIDKSVFPAIQGGPHNNVTAAIAEMFFEALQPSFKKYARQIVKNAKVLARELQKYGFKLLTGGTDNHLMLLDAASVGLDGMTAERKLEMNGIIANRNSLPNDTSPFRPSGVRLGTPALTTRGMKEKEMKKVAELINAVLILGENVRLEVKKLCRRFPIE